MHKTHRIIINKYFDICDIFSEDNVSSNFVAYLHIVLQCNHNTCSNY